MATKAQGFPDEVMALGAAELFGRSAQAIVALAPDATINGWNRAAEQLFGLRGESLFGKCYEDLIPEAEKAAFKTALGKIARRRSVPSRITRRLGADGEEIPVDFSMHGLWTEAGELAGILTLASDASRQVALETELRRQAAHTQAVVETVIDGIVTIDAAGIMNAVNPAVETLFGYRAHELIGRNVKVLMPEPYHSEHDDYIAAYLRTGHAKIIGIGRQVRAVHKDGTEFPIDLSVCELHIGDERGFVGVMRDITERVEAEQALRDLNQQLRAKIDELAEALEKLKLTQEQLVESEKMASLGNLVAGVAHEINTPVGVCVTASSYLAGATRNLRDQFEAGELRQSALQKYLKTAAESTSILDVNLRRAANLITSFKQVAVDRSSNLLRQFGLRQFLDELLDSLQPELRRHPHDVTIDCPDGLTVRLFPGVLSQVLTNLIQNALLHAFEPDAQTGQIKIEAERHEDRLQIRVSDNGIGIPKADVAKIFDPFFTTRRGQGGTGLGLSVTYNLVHQALEGEISVSSTPGEGTTFTLDLPLALDAADAADAADADAD